MAAGFYGLPEVIQKGDFKILRYCLAVAEHGNISQAARELGITQPALSRYLQNIAGQIGVPLFERTGNLLTLTYAGERYIETAKRILYLVEGLDTALQKQDRILRIVCQRFESFFIPPFAVKKFREQFPECRIIIAEKDAAGAQLRAGEADLAIITMPSGQPLADEQKVFDSVLLTREEVLLVTCANHPVCKMALWKEGCKHPWVDINLLRNENFADLYPDQTTRILSDALLSREHIAPRVVMQTRSILNSMRLAAVGAAVCFAPETGARNFTFSETPVFFSVGDPLLMDVYFLYDHNHSDNALIMEFITIVRSFVTV
jgi:DNA-binding transcriptional LysR family regulator